MVPRKSGRGREGPLEVLELSGGTPEVREGSGGVGKAPEVWKKSEGPSCNL